LVRPCRLAGLLAAAVIASAVNVPASADPKSDLFQPDVFGTERALAKRAPGLTDPHARDCPLPTTGITLSAAIDLGLCHNPATRSAVAAARQQAAVLGSAQSAWLPTITGTASEVRTLGGTYADALGSIVTSPSNTRDAAAVLSWTLYDFSGRGSRIRNADFLLDAAAATLNRTAQQLVFSVASGYFNAAAADDALVAAKTTEDVAHHSVEITKALRLGGVATLSDELQAETAYDQAVLSRLQAEGAAKTARGQLSTAIGLPADQALKLLPDPVPSETQPLEARMPDLMAEAVRQRPDLAAALAQRDAAEAEVTVARATGRPSISIQGGRQYGKTVSDNVSQNYLQNYNQIGIYITVPLFSGFNTGYEVRQAQAQLQGSEANADQVRLTVSLDVWNGYYALESANHQLTATANLTKTADSNQDVALGRYKAGIGTIIDVLTAQTAAANARQLRITAELNWNVARAQLALALGRLSSAEPLVNVNTLP
jgi:outer membrane protein TolC